MDTCRSCVPAPIPNKGLHMSLSFHPLDPLARKDASRKISSSGYVASELYRQALQTVQEPKNWKLGRLSPKPKAFELIDYCRALVLWDGRPEPDSRGCRELFDNVDRALLLFGSAEPLQREDIFCSGRYI
ncbi:hypothetical protein MTO96_000206 [Rhipicephalus appendiculatus]